MSASPTPAGGIPYESGERRLGGKVNRRNTASAPALAESALYHARLLENCNFEDIIIAVKASDVPTTIKATILAKSCHYPLHIGVTEAGGIFRHYKERRRYQTLLSGESATPYTSRLPRRPRSVGNRATPRAAEKRTRHHNLPACGRTK